MKQYLKTLCLITAFSASLMACSGNAHKHKQHHHDQHSMLSAEEAQAIIEPLYQMLSGDKSVVDGVRQNYSKNWQSYHSNEDYLGREDVIGFISGPLLDQIPNLNWEFKEIRVLSDNTVVVRGEATGTMASDVFLGEKVTAGKSFKIMAIDLHTIKDGKVVTSYHIEDWFGVVQQTR